MARFCPEKPCSRVSGKYGMWYRDSFMKQKASVHEKLTQDGEPVLLVSPLIVATPFAVSYIVPKGLSTLN